MSASQETVTTPFIVSTGLHKADQDTRKFIRKHVMLGKNTGKSSVKNRHSKGKPRRPPPALIPLVIAPSPAEDIHKLPNTLASDYPCSIPQRVGTDVSLVQLADVVEPSTASLVLRCRYRHSLLAKVPVPLESSTCLLLNLVSAVAKQTLFPLESCILFDRNEGRQWIELMAFDPVFLHTMIFTTLGYHDSLRSCQNHEPRDTQLSLHFAKALRLLRERLILPNDVTRFSDITLFTVLGLAIYAYLTREREAAEYHLSALRTIINFRGGVGAFWHSGKLLLELFRCDIGLALDNGSTTFFFTDPSVEPFPPYPEEIVLFALSGIDAMDTQGHQDNFVDELDNDLAEIWSIVKQFSARINLAYQTKIKLPKELLLDAMASIMYRLIHMSYIFGSLDEFIRLGLLAYSSSIFLQWRGTKLSLHYFSTAYRACLTAAQLSDILPDYIQLWLLMTGAVSIFEEHDDQWFKPQVLSIINSCGLRSWDQARDLLHSIMWIDLLHDTFGKRYFNFVVSNGSSVEVLHHTF